MVTLQSFKRIVHSFDMFCSSQLLRYHSQTQYKTMTGGLLSLIIICIVVGGFANMVSDTLQRIAITSSLVRQKQSDPPLAILQPGNDQMFMMGFSVQSIDYSFTADLTNGSQYFSLELNVVEIDGGALTARTKIPLQQCTREHWSMVPEFQAVYDSFNVKSWLCLPFGTQLPLQGTITSAVNTFAGIQVMPCNNVTSNNACAPQQDIDDLFALYQNFYLTWYYVNPVINANQQQYISYYVEGGDYIIFSSSIGSQAWVYFSDYTIATDNSILPYESISTDNGCIVQEKAMNHPYTAAQGGSVARIFFSKSENSLTFNRQVQKISAVLSYIGGLIGAITALLFLIKLYTDTSLEVAIGLSLFQLSQQQKQQHKKDQNNKQTYFNLFTFIRLISYRLIKFCGWKGKMQKAERLSRCQQEAIKQMDVQLLLKRVIKLETCMSKLFTPQQLRQIRQGHAITFKSAKNMRMLLLKHGQCDAESDNQSKIDNILDLKNQLSYPQFSEEEPKIDSGTSIFKIRPDKIAKSSIPFELASELDASSKIHQLKMVTRYVKRKENKRDDVCQKQIEKDEYDISFKNPALKAYPSVII